MRLSLPVSSLVSTAASGTAQLVIDGQHFHRIVREGILKATISVDIATADFKAMLIPDGAGSRRARSIVQVFRVLADRSVEIRLMHSGTPSTTGPAQPKKRVAGDLTIRRCPRLHAKTVVVDASRMYLGSAISPARASVPRPMDGGILKWRLDRSPGPHRCGAGGI